ncbi:hypothetical protein [Ekhidna sp.]|uniref:hypothetical protein n=1 Tax=Ekhidna sp. TaxID=2608089 RepID=UPI003CCBD306
MKRILLVALIYSSSIAVIANKDGETRTATVKVNVSSTDKLNIQAKYTELTIESWDKNEVEIEASVRFDGKITSKIQEFLDEFEERVNNNIDKNANELMIDTDLDLPNKIQIGSKSVGIIMSYGDDVFKVSYKIKAPSKNPYTITSSYEEVRMIGSFDQVTLSQYSGEFEAEYIKKADMNLKYGSAQVNEIGTAKFEIYEQELDINSIASMELNAKYSELEFEKSGTIEVTAYESDFIFNTIESLNGNFKYGNIEINNGINNGEFEFYEVDMEVEQGGDLVFSNSKYSKVIAEKIQKIEFGQSYEDETEIDELGSFRSTDSKYGKHRIGILNGDLELDAYEDELTIAKIGTASQLIQIDGKYIDASLGISNSSFNLQSNVKYGKVDYDEGRVEVKRYIKDSDQLELEIQSKSDESVKPTEIRVNGYEIKIELK